MTSAASLRVDTADPTPPYEQLRRQLAHFVATGVLSPGDRLPPLRQLAADLGLAVGTVARTYRELEAAHLVVSRRGGGTTVRPDLPPSAAPERAVEQLAESFVREARLLGADDDAIRSAVGRAIATPIRSGRSSRGGTARAGVPPGSRTRLRATTG